LTEDFFELRSEPEGDVLDAYGMIHGGFVILRKNIMFTDTRHEHGHVIF